MLILYLVVVIGLTSFCIYGIVHPERFERPRAGAALPVLKQRTQRRRAKLKAG